jgi:hypothetical protein
MTRISDPYCADVGMRVRRHPSGNVTRTMRRQRFVDVRCGCGAEYAVEHAKWLTRPPARCIRCHGVHRRERYAAEKARAA